MKVYLAGGKSDGWRRTLEARWPQHELIFPFRDSRQGAIFEFVNDDVAHVRTSGLVFGHHDYHVYGGMAAEFAIAYGAGIPVVYVCKQPRVDSFLAGLASAVFTDLEAAAEFAERRYLS